MAQVLIASEVQGFNSRFTGTTAYLRIWPSTDAYSALGEQLTGAPVDSQTWYQEYTCTVAAGVVTIPVVTLPATTDSYPPNLTFTAVLYDENGTRQNTKLSNFILDPDLLTATDDAVITSSVTVTAAGTSAAQGTYEYKGQYLLKAYYNLTGQADSTSLYAIRWNGTQWQITSSSGAVYYYSTEDVTNPWDVETWVSGTGAAPLPAVTQAPVTISCNWQAVFLTNNIPCIPCDTDRNWLLAWLLSYIGNISVPWASTIASGVGGKVYISKVPILSYQPEAVGTNEWAWQGVDDSRYLYEWNGDLAAAITDIGATEVTLWITAETQFTYTAALQTSGTLTIGKVYDFDDYRGAAVYLNNVNGGVSYSVASGLATTGGSGTGLTVDITAVSGTGAIDGIEINNAGSGYRVGDVIIPTQLGGNNGRIVIVDVYNGNFTNVGATFLGYPTNFANKTGTVFIATGTTPTSWGATSLRPCLVVPSNIHIAFSGAGSLRATGGGGIYIKSLRDPGDVRVFKTDGDGKIFVAPQATTKHNLAWWSGMTPDVNNTHEFTQLQQSLSVGLVGGTAVIPVGDWKTDQITWTSNVKVVGNGADIDGGQKGTAIYPANEAALYTGVFSVQQLFHSVTFEDLMLTANQSATVNAFRFIAVQSTSENMTFNRVRFETVCPTVGAVPNTILKAENSFQEFVNVNFIQCTWTCWDETYCIFWESTNSVAYLENCQFRPRVKSVGFYAPFAGYINFNTCEWRGPLDYTGLPFTTNRTIASRGNTTATDKTVTLDPGTPEADWWTRQDLGAFITIPGVTWGASLAAKTYITGLNTNLSIEVADVANQTVVNQNVVVSYPGDYPSLATACIELVVHICVNAYGSSDEGVNYFLIDRSFDYNDTFNMFGCKVQGRMLFAGGSSSVNSVGSEFYSGAFNSTGGDPIIRMLGGEVSEQIVPRDEEEYPFPNFRELLSAEVWHLCPNDIDVVTDTSTKMGDNRITTYNQISTPMQLLHRKQSGGNPDTVPQLALLSGKNAGDPNKAQLQIATAYPGSMIARHWYNIQRDLTSGYLAFEGNQTGFIGYDFNGLIVADGGIRSLSPLEGVGYNTGAGGVVTQITNKATTVVLNKTTGQITMNGAALNAGVTVTFQMTNSSARTNDTLSICHASGGTAGAYLVYCTGVANLGGYYINVMNVTAGNLSEAIVLNFNVIRGAGA